MDKDRALELLQFAERAEPHLYGPDQRAWRARLDEAADAISQALGFFLDAGDVDAALRLAGALRLFWMDTGRVDQGRRWLGAALAAHDGSPSLSRAQALVAAGELAFRQGDQAAARSWTTQSLEHAQLLGHRPTAALAHTNLARIALRDGDAGAIERHARAGVEASGDELYARSRAVHMLAWAAHAAGDIERARAVFVESLGLRRRLGDRLGQAVELSNLGDLARGAGDAEAAAGLLLEALEIAAELDSRYLLPGLLASLAVVAGERGDLERAARLLGASQAHYEAAGLVPDPVDANDPDRMQASARDRLGADRFARLWEQGRQLSLDQAVAQARSVAG
jgi:ATP/maltotriose-dependent transcriptional regulator MalT